VCLSGRKIESLLEMSVEELSPEQKELLKVLNVVFQEYNDYILHPWIIDTNSMNIDNPNQGSSIRITKKGALLYTTDYLLRIRKQVASTAELGNLNRIIYGLGRKHFIIEKFDIKVTHDEMICLRPVEYINDQVSSMLLLTSTSISYLDRSFC